MKVIVDNDTLLFDMTSSKLSNGMMIPKDSVEVRYIEDDGDTLRALEVSVIPRPGKVVNLDSMKHNKLITR